MQGFLDRDKFNHYSASTILEFLGFIDDGKNLDQLIKNGKIKGSSWEVDGDSLRRFIQEKLKAKDKEQDEMVKDLKEINQNLKVVMKQLRGITKKR